MRREPVPPFPFLGLLCFRKFRTSSRSRFQKHEVHRNAASANASCYANRLRRIYPSALLDTSFASRCSRTAFHVSACMDHRLHRALIRSTRIRFAKLDSSRTHTSCSHTSTVRLKKLPSQAMVCRSCDSDVVFLSCQPLRGYSALNWRSRFRGVLTRRPWAHPDPVLETRRDSRWPSS